MEEQTNQTSRGNFYQPPFQVNLPNSNTILILGILSLIFCWWHILSFVGIILSIVTLSLSRKELAIFYLQPSQYTLSSLNNVKAGRVCATIGLIISIVVFLVALLMIIGFLTLLPIWGMVD
ncbi:MAG: CCC motif membrane protein [Bacteroidetes bacterium]|nr:CCC motif membrane protein [Bacteroidota bacterium]